MGTSLSGLTPATTFDGLLKTSDNEPLDGTLKTISDGSGVDTILQLSDSALQVNGQATMVGLTNNTSASAILAQNSDAYTLMQVRNDGTTIINNNAYSFSQPRFTSTKEVVIHQGLSVGQTASPTSRLHIKGSGATSATTSLLVQNSAGTDMLKVQDDGNIVINNKIGFSAYSANINSSFGLSISTISSARPVRVNGSSGLYVGAANGVDTPAGSILTEGSVGIGETTPTARLHVKAGTTLDTIARFEDPESATSYLDIKQDSGTFATYTTLFYGDSPKIRSKQGGRLYLESTNEIRFATGTVVNTIFDETGSVAHGSNSLPANTRLFVKGSGATSATTALLVQNSAGSELFKVQDDGLAIIKSALITANTHLAQYVSGTNWYIHVNGSTTIGRGGGAVASAVLELDSTTKGFLPPRMTTTERDAISSPATGLMVYNTTTNKAQCYNGTTWNDLF